MKMLKVLGMSTLISGVTCFGTYIYNQTRMDQEQRLFWYKEMVRRYSPEKYNELKNANIEDLDVWINTERNLRDSVEQARIQECDAHRSYFHGGKNHIGCCK